jgi:hypothetical protein
VLALPFNIFSGLSLEGSPAPPDPGEAPLLLSAGLVVFASTVVPAGDFQNIILINININYS